MLKYEREYPDAYASKIMAKKAVILIEEITKELARKPEETYKADVA